MRALRDNGAVIITGLDVLLLLGLQLQFKADGHFMSKPADWGDPERELNVCKGCGRPTVKAVPPAVTPERARQWFEQMHAAVETEPITRKE